MNFRPVVVTVQNESIFETVVVLASLKENDLKKSRKPKNITNYRALLGSFIASNKRKSSDGDAKNKTTVQSRKSTKSHQSKKLPPDESRFIIPNRPPTYTESELRSLMKSPDISVMSNNNNNGSSNLTNKRKSSERGGELLSHYIQELSKSQQNLIQQSNEGAKKRRTRTDEDDDLEDLDLVNKGATTSNHFTRGINKVFQNDNFEEDNQENDMDKTKSQLNGIETDRDSDSSEVFSNVVRPPITIDDESDGIILNPNPIFPGSSEIPRVPIRKPTVPLFMESDLSVNNTFQRAERKVIKDANRKSNLLFRNVIRATPFNTVDGEVLVPPSDDEEDF